MKLKTNILLNLVVSVTIIACSANTPNNIELHVQPGMCVTSQYPNYEVTSSSVAPYNSFRLNAYMGESSPYCMALTLTNNNSGENANNIQVYQGGLSISYTIGGNLFTGYMIDYNAAGVGQNNFAYYTNQVVGNIALFDPNNCVTTQGINVHTLHKNGQSCTFYLQIINEAMPVGVYPLGININYTNGNANYSVGTTIYQQVGLFAGGDFTVPGIHLGVYDGNNNFSALSIKDSLPNWQNIQLLARDVAGNLYAYDSQNIYKYNGQFWQIIPHSPAQINDLVGDSFGNVLAATQTGVYRYQVYNSTVPEWSLVSGIPNSNIAAIRAESQNSQNILYTASNIGGIESCILTNSNSICNSISSIYTGNNFNNQALAINKTINKVVWGTESGVYNNGELLSATPNISQFGRIGFDKFDVMYIANKQTELDPAVFNNLTNANQLLPLIDYSSNILFGQANGVYLRSSDLKTTGVMSLYGYGKGLSSLVPFNQQYLVLMSMAVESVNAVNSYVAKSNWTPITGFNNQVNNVIVSSRLSVESQF